MKKILIVIPTYNACNHIINCLSSIKRAIDIAESNSFETDVVVVDDLSPDNTVQLLKDSGFKNILLGTGNLWWSGSVNRGVEQALKNGYDYIMLLNSDNTLSESFFSNLYQHIQQMPDNVIGSIVYDTEGRHYFTGCRISKLGQFSYMNDTERPIRNCSIFGGMGVTIPADVFRKVGLFDEKRFPLYFGDTDFWVRCMRDDIPSVICSDLNVYADLENTGVKRSHKGLMSTLRNMFNIRFHANLKTVSRFYWKNYPAVISPIAIVLFYVRALKKAK